jgi:hypothetical protein
MFCSLSNYFGSNEFGDHFVLKYILGTLEMYWMLVSFSKKVLSLSWGHHGKSHV